MVGGCVRPGAGGRGSHFDAHYWGDGVAAQIAAPDRLLFQMMLLETAGLAAADHHLQEEATENSPITEASTANGDGTAAGLTDPR